MKLTSITKVINSESKCMVSNSFVGNGYILFRKSLLWVESNLDKIIDNIKVKEIIMEDEKITKVIKEGNQISDLNEFLNKTFIYKKEDKKESLALLDNQEIKINKIHYDILSGIKNTENLKVVSAGNQLQIVNSNYEVVILIMTLK